MDNGQPAAEFPFTIDWADWSHSLTIRAMPQVVIDGIQVESPEDAPTGAAVPAVIGWRDRDSGHLVESAVLALDKGGSTRWSVVLSQPPDTAISLVLRAERVSQA